MKCSSLWENFLSVLLIIFFREKSLWVAHVFSMHYTKSPIEGAVYQTWLWAPLKPSAGVWSQSSLSMDFFFIWSHKSVFAHPTSDCYLTPKRRGCAILILYFFCFSFDSFPTDKFLSRDKTLIFSKLQNTFPSKNSKCQLKTKIRWNLRLLKVVEEVRISYFI